MPLQTRETAIQNEVVRLYCQFQNNGLLTDPSGQPLIEIIGADGITLIDSISAQKEFTGIYYVDWYVPKNLPVGTYYDKWTFQWDANSSVQEISMPIQVRTFDNYLNFISNGLSHKLSNRTVQLLKDLENFFAYEATHIPIYWEQAMRTQQEDQQKRTKTYYYFELSQDEGYVANEGDIYFHNGHKFTVFETLYVNQFYSSSSSSSSTSSTSSDSGESNSSSSSVDSSSSSLSSASSNSSSSSTSSYTSSSSSESMGNSSSSSTETEEPELKVYLTCVSTGTPLASGTLTKVSGDEESTEQLNFTSYTSKRSKFSTIYNLVFRNWVRDFKPIVRVNQRIVDDGWYTDFDGKIYFDRLMTPYDTVEVTYKFSCFSVEQMLGFLRMGLMMMNTVPPASTTYSTLDNMPSNWNAPVLLYASIQLLRRALMGINFQEKRAIYGGAGNDEWASSTVGILQSLYQDLNTQWDTVKKDVKTNKLPQSALISVPEYSLPGSRCMSLDTCINFVVAGKIENMTIKEAYSLFKKDKSILVESMKDEKIVWSLIENIWKSGKKTTYLVKTANAEIRLSKKHLVYLPIKNAYVPTKDLKEGDCVLVNIGDKLEIEHILFTPKKYGVEYTYDIEVPDTNNFIGNNIVTHNSRYFRYLYKT